MSGKQQNHKGDNLFHVSGRQRLHLHPEFADALMPTSTQTKGQYMASGDGSLGGSTRAWLDLAKHERERQARQKADLDRGAKRAAEQSARDRKRRAAKSGSSSQTADGSAKSAGAGLLAIAVLGGGWTAVQSNKVVPVTLTADSAHWSYALPIEAYRPQARSLTVKHGKTGAPPEEAYNVSKRQVYVRTDPIYETQTLPATCTGTRDVANADGEPTTQSYTYDCMKEQQVKIGETRIHNTKYSFVVNRWVDIDPITAKGENQSPDFPVFQTREICLSDTPELGCQRPTGDAETQFKIRFSYVAAGESKRRTLSHELPQQTWRDINLKATYPAVLNGFGKVRALKGLDDNYDKLIQNR